MFNTIPDLNQKELERFWKRVNKESSTNRSLENPELYSHVIGNCWEWTGGVRSQKDPYGRLRVNKVMYDAHRVAYKLQHKEDPGELLVCHHCDNPRCVRKEHIYAGDSFQNSHDRRDRDRMNLNPQHGEERPTSVLVESQVREIFHKYHKLGFTCEELSIEYKVANSRISEIVRGVAWKHLNLADVVIDNKRRGERSPTAKLTKEQVIEIYLRRVRGKETTVALAKEFGVYSSAISNIALKKKWKEVTDSIAI